MKLDNKCSSAIPVCVTGKFLQITNIILEKKEQK